MAEGEYITAIHENRSLTVICCLLATPARPESRRPKCEHEAVTSVSSPVQCSTGPFWTYQLEEAFDLIAEAGFSAIELMITRDPRTHDPVVCRELARDRGLSIDAVHGPFLLLTRTVWGLNAIGKVERGVELCRGVGASTLVVHPPLPWERDYERWLARRHLHPGDVKVAVETMYPKWVAGRRLRAYRWLDPRDLLSHSPWVVMDTSHLALARVDIIEAFNLLLPRLAHIHLSDQAGDNKDGHLGLGEGMLPVDRLIDEIERREFSGSIALELSVARYAGRPQELVETLKRNRERLTAALGRRPRKAKGPPRT